MSWVNPVFPIDAKNSIYFFVPFFLGQPGLVGDSVEWSLSKANKNHKLKCKIAKTYTIEIIIQPSREKMLSLWQYNMCYQKNPPGPNFHFCFMKNLFQSSLNWSLGSGKLDQCVRIHVGPITDEHIKSFRIQFKVALFQVGWTYTSVALQLVTWNVTNQDLLTI